MMDTLHLGQIKKQDSFCIKMKLKKKCWTTNNHRQLIYQVINIDLDDGIIGRNLTREDKKKLREFSN
jgi:hypothetical protein